MTWQLTFAISTVSIPSKLKSPPLSLRPSLEVQSPPTPLTTTPVRQRVKLLSRRSPLPLNTLRVKYNIIPKIPHVNKKTGAWLIALPIAENNTALLQRAVK